MTSLGPRWFTGLLKPSNAETFPLDSCASRCLNATCVLYQTSSAQGRTYEEVLAIYHHTSSRAANPHEIPTSKETQLVSKWKVESRCNGTLGEDATTHQNAEQVANLTASVAL
jgi:hypothetical protein